MLTSIKVVIGYNMQLQDPQVQLIRPKEQLGGLLVAHMWKQ